MLFKVPVVFIGGTNRINYTAIDPAHNSANKLFKRTKIIDESGTAYLVGEYLGQLNLTPLDGVLTVVKRILSVDDFIDRIPRPAYETITNNTSNQAKTFIALLNARTSLDLNNDKVEYYVGRMLSAGLITQAEHDAILA